jgi:Gas vesicle protein G
VFSVLVRLPFLPVIGVVRIAELIADEADRELFEPAAVRRRLEEATQAQAAGLITDEEFEVAQRQAAAAALHSGH